MPQRNRQACQPDQHYLCPASPRRRLRYRNGGCTMDTGATGVNKPVIVTGVIDRSDAYRVLSRNLAPRRAGDPITFYRYRKSNPRKKQAATTTSVCQIGSHGEWLLTQHHGSFQNSTQQLGYGFPLSTPERYRRCRAEEGALMNKDPRFDRVHRFPAHPGIHDDTSTNFSRSFAVLDKPYLKLPAVEVELHNGLFMVTRKGFRWYIWIEKVELVVDSLKFSAKVQLRLLSWCK
ncbi:hypothetical protein ACJA88_005905 [Fusarium oxysporum]